MNADGDRCSTWLRLTPRKVLWFVLAWIACVVLHNVVYGLLRGWFAPGWDEPVFFLLAVIVLPLWFLASVVFTVFRAVAHRC